MKRCAICGCKIEGYGNNPWPVRTSEEARCCDDCNSLYVISARIKMMGMEKEKYIETANMLNELDIDELNGVLL